MRQPEGLRITLSEEALLDTSGIFSGSITGHCTEAYGLPDASVELFLLIAGAGEEGLAQSKIPNKLRTELKTHLLPLEMQGLINWERDGRGRLAYLVLTWKGQEAIEAARPKQPSQLTAADRRRRALQG